MTTVTIQVNQDGAIILPADVQQQYNIQPGDTFYLVDIEGILVLTPQQPLVAELSKEIERARLAAGLTIEELLESLREQREKYVSENYGL
jgi:bifunctional DNA-binding transcriptional regulator/antitoxin component of YhaV-PrlF toxin-antitoxin module